jgi:SAM-dependent methyltransferase
VAEWSLPREDLGLRLHAAPTASGGTDSGAGGTDSGAGGCHDAGARPGGRERAPIAAEAFRPLPHERAQDGAARLRSKLRRTADLQFGSIWRDLAQLLPRVRGVLADVGAGAQPFRDLLSSDVRYIAVDSEDAERQFGYRTPDTRYFHGPSLPLADAEATTILCTETLEHVRDTVPFLAELRRALAPGGLLILTVPFAARWHYVPQDFWRFTPAALDYVLKAAGFREVRVYARGGALAVACYKVLGFILLMLLGGGQRGMVAFFCGAAGVVLMPVALLAVTLGNVGLRFPESTDDTLGYTVLAC